MRKLTLGTLIAGAALFALVLAPPPAAACTCFCDDLCDDFNDCCPGCGGGGGVDFDSPNIAKLPTSVTVSPIGTTGARIEVHGAVTLSMGGGTSCSAALPALNGLGTVDAIRLNNIATGELVYEFLPNTNAGPSFAKLAEDEGPRGARRGDWTGFHAYVTEHVPSGVATSFVVDVTLAKGVSFRQLVWKLRSGGLLGGGSAYADGGLDFHHFFVRGLSEMPFEVTR